MSPNNLPFYFISAMTNCGVQWDLCYQMNNRSCHVHITPCCGQKVYSLLLNLVVFARDAIGIASVKCLSVILQQVTIPPKSHIPFEPNEHVSVKMKPIVSMLHGNNRVVHKLLYQIAHMIKGFESHHLVVALNLIHMPISLRCIENKNVCQNTQE